MNNDFLIIPEYQRRKVSIPKPLKDLFILPFNKSLESVVEPFQGDDDLRPERSGIFFDSQLKQVCATDAHKLIRLKMPDSSAEVVQTGIYLSTKQIEKRYKELTKLSNDFAKENPFEDYIKERKNVTVDGKYPNFNAIIPSADFSVSVDCEKLLWFSSVMTDAKILLTDDINSLKDKEAYQQGKINYLSEKYFPFNNTLHTIYFRYINYLNETEYIGVNSELLKDTLTSLFKLNGFKTRNFYLSSPSRAILIQGNSGSFSSQTDDLALLMPVMIADYTYDKDGNNIPFITNEFTNEKYSVIYDLNENAIVSNGEVFPIDESLGYVEPKKEKQSVAPKAAVESTKEKVVFTPEFIRKRIGALQIALRLAEKKEDNVIEKGKRVVITGGIYKGKEGLLVSNDVVNGDYSVQIDGTIKGIKSNEVSLLKDVKEEKYVPNISFEDWLKLKNITYYKRSYYWVADDGGDDYMYSGEYKDVLKFLRDEWKKYLVLANK
jgi:hypothetical protein